MKKVKKFKLAKEEKLKAIQDIREYFASERNEDIGDLAAEIILDFITEKIGPYYYNQAIIDAKKYINDRAEDLFELTL